VLVLFGAILMIALGYYLFRPYSCPECRGRLQSWNENLSPSHHSPEFLDCRNCGIAWEVRGGDGCDGDSGGDGGDGGD
jgi:uncharacterized protein YbaR (Trm112 family)